MYYVNNRQRSPRQEVSSLMDIIIKTSKGMKKGQQSGEMNFDNYNSNKKERKTTKIFYLVFLILELDGVLVITTSLFSSLVNVKGSSTTPTELYLHKANKQKI